MQQFSKWIYRVILLFTVFTIGFNSYAQEEQCATVVWNDYLKEKGHSHESIGDFESWLGAKIIHTKQAAAKKKTQVYKIPVVVHIIHNGEGFGQGANIPTEQVLSQIAILNEDFRRLNADASQTPAMFQSVAADIEIEFVLAKRNPQGLPTDGITRIEGPQERYRSSDHGIIASLSYWPAEEYLNIWVAPMQGSILGWAQFPLSNLEGLENVNTTRLTDGVVINYEYFGEGFNARAFSKGRTATHEIGHFLGLRHIWGDGGCSASDFCDDTPDASESTNGCPAEKSSCGSPDMFQNYMDYTNDVCMNLFTQDQKWRMRTVLENSPRRLSLLSSPGAEEPEPLELDAALINLPQGLIASCSNIFTPTVRVKNLGQNTINQMRVQLRSANNELIEEVLETQALFNLQERNITFNTQDLPEGITDYTYRIFSVNNRIDDNPNNNQATISVRYTTEEAITHTSGLALDLSRWDIYNPDQNKTWEFKGNKEVYIDIFNYLTADGLGEKDWLISPSFNVSDYNFPYLTFEYAQAEGRNVDRLEVLASTDCGVSFPIELFSRSGSFLATAYKLDEAFSPTYDNDWRKIAVNIAQLSFYEAFTLAFVSTNGEGQSIYIRNVTIEERYPFDYNISLKQSNNKPYIQCGSNFRPALVVVNNGALPLQNFSVRISEGNQILADEQLNITVSSGNTFTLNLGEINLSRDTSTLLKVDIYAPNGFEDQDPSDNTAFVELKNSQQQTDFPFRFDTSDDSWFLLSNSTELDWDIISNPFHKRGTLKAPTAIANDSERFWLVSPIFSLATENDASFSYKFAYTAPYFSNERIRLWLSEDCGNSYNVLLADDFLDELSVDFNNGPTLPADQSNFVLKQVSLNNFLNKDKLRLALEVIGAGGNDVYLQEMAFYTSQREPVPVPDTGQKVILFPNPTSDVFNVLFDFDEHKSVLFQFIDTKGSIVKEERIEAALNQQYQMAVDNLANGIYILSVRYDNERLFKRVMVNR